MTKTLTIKDNKLYYDEIEENRKSFALTIYPTGRLLFKTPILASIKERKNFLDKKKMWIQKQHDFFKQFRHKQQTYISGSDVLYLGRHYQLIIKNQLPEKISFAANKLMVYTKNSPDKLLNIFMQDRAKRIFEERLYNCLQLFPSLSQKQFKLKVRKMNKRWGSYHKDGYILLNPELIKAPKRCIDYVIIHELCHHKYKDHSKKFFTLLAQKCPNYKALKTELELKVLG